MSQDLTAQTLAPPIQQANTRREEKGEAGRWTGIVCGVLLLFTAIVPWGIDGHGIIWPWRLFERFFAFSLKTTIVAAWSAGLLALFAGIFLRGTARTFVYALAGVVVFTIYLVATHARSIVSFVPVEIPCVWLQAISLMAIPVLLLITETRTQGSPGSVRLLRCVGALAVLGMAIYGGVAASKGFSDRPGQSLLALAAAGCGAVGCVLIIREALNHGISLTGRRLVLTGLFLAMAGEVTQSLFLGYRPTAALWWLNDQIIFAATALLALTGLAHFAALFNKSILPICAALAIGIGVSFVDWDRYDYATTHTIEKDGPGIPRSGDWPEWCGAPDRNMISHEKNLPATFDALSRTQTSGLKNIKWIAPLSARVLGSPVISGGKVFIGGQMGEGKNECAVLWCLQESDGKLLWRMMSPYIPYLYNVHTFGACATPTVEGDRLYMLNHLGDVLCMTTRGLGAGNQGPFTDEAEYFATGRKRLSSTIEPDGRRNIECSPGTPATLGPLDADIVWRYDLLREVNCWPFNALNAAIVVRGDRLYVPTCSTYSDTWFGDESSRKWIQDWKAKNEKKNSAYDSPSLIVLDKANGKLLAKNDYNIFEKTFHGAHASPALGFVNHRELLIYGGGNGVCYAFDPEFIPGTDGKPGDLKLVWKFDCMNGRIEKAEIIATPVLYKNRVYVSIGNDLTNSGSQAGPGRLVCIDATQSGEITRTAKRWSFDEIRSTDTTVAIADGLLYTGDAAGNIYCLDADTGRLYWQHSTPAPVWSSPIIADGKVYIGTHGRGLLVFEHSKEKKLLAQNINDADIVASPAIANGVLYIASQKHLYAIETGKTGGLVEPDLAKK